MTQYLIATYDKPETRSTPAAQMQPIVEAVGALIDEALQTGIFVFAGGLHDPSASTVVDPSGTVTDGPFLESKECLGGFTVIDVPDLDAALAFARRMAEASGLSQEVRPFQSEEEFTEAMESRR
jgi:hypothetical protein